MKMGFIYSISLVGGETGVENGTPRRPMLHKPTLNVDKPTNFCGLYGIITDITSVIRFSNVLFYHFSLVSFLLAYEQDPIKLQGEKSASEAG